MKKLSNAIDRFCQRRPNFGIPRLMLWVVIANVVVYLFSMMDRTGALLYYLFFNPQLILRGQLWRLVTFIFIPASTTNPFFLLISLYFYYFIGSTLEKQWGKAKFTVYYLSGVLFTVIYALLVGLVTGAGYIPITASYINLSMFFVFATYYPEHRVLLFFFIPVKIKWLAYLDAALFLFSIIRGAVLGSLLLALLPIVAVLNYFIFCGDMLMAYIRDFIGRRRVRRSPTVINFKKAAREAHRETEGKPYTRKCAVCGRTDADYPDLEFRYCSRCQGYHCFCADHINNHVHFTE